MAPPQTASGATSAATTDPDYYHCSNSQLTTPGYAYSTGFTTCGSADAAYAYFIPQAGNWSREPGYDGRVAATLWFPYFTSTGQYQGIEVGYEWNVAYKCYYYEVIMSGRGRDTNCLQMQDTPSPGSMEIVRRQGSGTIFDIYLNGTLKISKSIFSQSSHRVSAGFEEYSSSFLNGAQYSGNATQKSTFTDLYYRDTASGTWYNWGPFSHCFVNYDRLEGFSADSFSTTFSGAIGPWGGSYPGCDGSTPNPPRSTW